MSDYGESRRLYSSPAGPVKRASVVCSKGDIV